MKKTLLIAVGILALLVVGFYALNNFIYYEKQGEGGFQEDYKNTTYTIDGKEVPLEDGFHEAETAPGSISALTTEYFGNEAEGDLNGDGISDIAFLLTQQGGGSGVFFYVVAALKTNDGYEGTNALFIGNRIAPQSTEIVDGEIIVNFADRNFEDPMTAAPTVNVTKRFVVEFKELVEVE